MTTPGPGWYNDGSGTQRWWDGTAWTEDTQPLVTANETKPTAQPIRLKRPWFIAAGIGTVLAVAAGIAIPLSLSQSGKQTPPADPTEMAEAAANQFLASIHDEDCSRYDTTTTTTDLAAQLASTGCADLFQTFATNRGPFQADVEADTATLTRTSSAFYMDAPDCRPALEIQMKKYVDGWKVANYTVSRVAKPGSDAPC